MKLDLEGECFSCSGTGDYCEWGQPEQKRGHTYYPKKGETIVFRVKGGCHWCNGTGRSLTSFGEEVLEVVRRHLNAKPAPIPPKDE